jgi:hypothetical protein
MKLKSIGEKMECPKILAKGLFGSVLFLDRAYYINGTIELSLNYETPDVVYNLFRKSGFTVLDLCDRSEFY